MTKDVKVHGMRLLFSREGSWAVSSFNSSDCNNSLDVREGLLRKPARALAGDPEGVQDRDRVGGVAPGRDPERDRGPAEGKRLGVVNSFRLEVLERTDGCLSGRLRAYPRGLKSAVRDKTEFSAACAARTYPFSVAG